MKLHDPPKRLRLGALLLVFGLCFLYGGVAAQNAPVSLARMLVQLQSKENNLTLAQRNAALIKQVQTYGVTFKFGPEIEKELVSAGASAALVNAIKLKAVRPTPSPSPTVDPNRPDATYERIWVEPNIVENSVSGVRIHAKFTVRNLKDVSSDVVYRFQKDGAFLKGSSTAYKTQSGELSTRRYLKPAHTAAVFQEYAFIPYSEFGLSAGTYNLKLDADVIKRDGTMVKHLTLQDLTLVIPAGTIPAKPATTATPAAAATAATLDKIWIERDMTFEGKLGMIIHTKFTVRGYNGKNMYLQILFEKADGTKLFNNNEKYRSRSGQTAAYKSMKPAYDAALFNDLSVFVPYEELRLPVGDYNLRFKVDLINPDYSQIQFLSSYDFNFKSTK